MMTPTHFLGGYLALQASKKLWSVPELSSTQIFFLFIFGLVLSVVIDLDVLFTGGIAGHHKQLTHYPFFWLLVSIFIYLTGSFLKVKLVESLAIVVLVTSWTHMALDLFGVTMEIYLLWPFSTKEFSVTPLRTDFVSNQERWNYIMRSPVPWIGDSIVILVGLSKMGLDLFKLFKR